MPLSPIHAKRMLQHQTIVREQAIFRGSVLCDLCHKTASAGEGCSWSDRDGCAIGQFDRRAAQEKRS